MCPSGYALALTLQAWSFSLGAWVDVHLCFSEAEQQGVTIFDRREVNIYQAIVKNKPFWVIDEGDKNDDRRDNGVCEKDRKVHR